MVYARPMPERNRVMQVKDYMQTSPITVMPEDLVRTAQRRMHDGRVRHLPVIEGQRTLVGVLTDRDIRQAGASDAPHMATYDLGYLLDKMTVRDIMSTQIVTVQPETSLAEAGQLFLTHKFSCLPVIQADQTLEGILTITDLLCAYVDASG